MLPRCGPEGVSTCPVLRWLISVELETAACIGQPVMTKHSVLVPQAVTVYMVAILPMYGVTRNDLPSLPRRKSTYALGSIVN